MFTQVHSIAEGVEKPAGHYLAETIVTTLASGQPLAFTAHILRGRQSGPTVGILSGLHGDEFSTAELVLSLLDLISIDELAGTLVLVPMANTLGFETATRSTSLDMANLNRVFPGNANGTVTEMLAHSLCENFLDVCDVLFDTHSEPDSMAIRCFYSALPIDDYGQRALALSKASGCPIIFTTKAIPGSLGEAAQNRGVLAVMPETGGPLPGKAGLMDEAQSELLNMLRHLSVLPGSVTAANTQVIVDAVRHVRAPVGGLFRPVVGFDAVGKSVAGETLLGTVASPYTGETMAELRASFEQSWMMMVRGRTSRVHPGDILYIIGCEGASPQ